jgi:hypothetical protein
MAYQFSNAAREISSIKRISTRNLLMVIASAVDQKTGTGFWSAGCLMHWSQLSKGTFYTAVEELENTGILRRERRRKGNRTNLWTLDIKAMESLRVSWDSVKPKDAAPEEQNCEPQPDLTDQHKFDSWGKCSLCGVGRHIGAITPCQSAEVKAYIDGVAELDGRELTPEDDNMTVSAAFAIEEVI